MKRLLDRNGNHCVPTVLTYMWDGPDLLRVTNSKKKKKRTRVRHHVLVSFKASFNLRRETNSTYAFQSRYFMLSPPPFLSLPLSNTPLVSHSGCRTILAKCGSCTLPFHPLLVFPFCTYAPFIHSSLAAPRRSPLLDVARMYVRRLPTRRGRGRFDFNPGGVFSISLSFTILADLEFRLQYLS